MWTMFISICVFSQCSWLEVEQPRFHNIAHCETQAQITRLELLGQLADGRIAVHTECVSPDSVEQFRQDQMKSHRLRQQNP